MPSARGPRPAGRVDHEVDLARRDEVDRVASPRRRLADLGHDRLDREPVGLERRRRCPRSRRSRSRARRSGAPRRRPARLVAVGEREEHRALVAAARCPRAAWLFANAMPNDAVDAHDLAGRAHLGPEHRVDVGEAVERQHRLLHRDVAAVGRRAQQPFGRAARRASRRPSPAPRPWPAARRSPCSRTAPCGSRAGSPRSRRRSPSFTAYCTLSSPTTSSASASARVCASIVRDDRRRASVGGGIAHAESPECTPASSMCSITPPMTTSPVRVAQRVDVDLDRVLEEAVDRAPAARPTARPRARASPSAASSAIAASRSSSS